MRTANLIVKDEVNVKIEGLDLEARKRLSNKFKYEVPYARYLPAVRLGRWDGKVSYFQLGGSTFINLLPDIIPILEEMRYDINLTDHREYETDFKLEPVSAETFSDKKWPKGHVVAGEPVVLRDYNCSQQKSSHTNRRRLC